jgi:hypothetical protein
MLQFEVKQYAFIYLMKNDPEIYEILFPNISGIGKREDRSVTQAARLMTKAAD